MKGILATLLLLALGFNLVGYHVLVKVQQMQLRKEVKQRIKIGLSEEELTTIVIATGEEGRLDWKNDHEFIYEGELFDLVRSETIADGTVIHHALPDHQEHDLITRYLANLKKDKNSKNRRGTPLRYQKVLLRLPPSTLRHAAVVLEEGTTDPVFREALYRSVVLDVTSPPPRSV
ncbi:MAG: hypothetical protein KDB88_13900 [Flavobacteriales bacterium]|nr:hypothetical protein [Flavobacteriales bacterium]